MRRGALAPLLLGSLCLMLSGVLALEIAAERAQPDADVAPVPMPNAPAAHVTPSLPPLTDFREVLARPLFAPTRRPREAPAMASGGPPKALEATLRGVVILPDSRVGLFQLGNAPEMQRIAEGQEIAGWRLERVLPDRVVLRADRVEEVKLHEEKSAMVGTVPAPPTASVIGAPHRPLRPIIAIPKRNVTAPAR